MNSPLPAARAIDLGNGFSFDLLFGIAKEGGQSFRGIGEVRRGKHILRSAALPWTLYTETDSGLRFEEFTLLGVEPAGEGVTLVLASRGTWMPRAQSADAMGDARFLARRTATATATFRWTFAPAARRIAGLPWSGLAMTISIDSPGHPLHWLLESATWEIGGQATGATLIQQDVSTIDLEQRVEAGSRFSTIERFHTEGSGAWGGSFPMDMLPRAAGSAFLDFQAKGALALALFAEKPGLTRARLEKHADEDVIHYLDRPFVKLGERITFPTRHLLIHDAGHELGNAERRNLWLDAFCHVRAALHASYGFALEVPLPCVHTLLWDADLKRLGVDWHAALREAMPTYRKLGFTEVVTHGVWNSITSDPAKTEADGNICCPYDFTYAEAFGGAAGMRKLVEAGEAAGIRTFQWFSFHLSKDARVWKDHPEWVQREAGGDPWDGQYHVLWSGRICSPYGDWFSQQILDVRAATGMGGIFFDSYQNLGVTCVDWQGPERAPQAEAIWRLQGTWQAAGYRQRCEVVTPFGITHVAMFGFAEDRFRRRLWDARVRDHQLFALMDTAPGFFSDEPFTEGRIGPQEYFRLAAHRCLPAISANSWNGVLPGGANAEAYAATNHQYLAALPQMHRLRLVEDGSCTWWHDAQDRPAVLWALRDCNQAIPGTMRDLVDGSLLSGTAPVKAGRVYVLHSGTR